MTHSPDSPGPAGTRRRSIRQVLLTAACGAGLALAAGYTGYIGHAASAADSPAAASSTAAPRATPAAAANTPNAPRVAPPGTVQNADFNTRAATPASGDHTMWGGTPHRNMVSGEKNPPTDWDVDSGKNIKWTADLGSKSYSGPTVAEGKVYVGTNNEAKKDPKYADAAGNALDGGVLMCFDEKSGKFLWQQYYAKLASGRVNDWPGEGLCSTAYAEKGKVWYCNNRCEVVCLDVTASEPRELWKKDMMKELGVFPHNMTSSSIASYGDLIYVITGNGVDDTHKNVVAPNAPGIVCFNKNDGKVIWTDNSPGPNILHGQWSSVAITEVNGRPLVIAPLGDAWVYAYDAKTGKIVWKFDANPKESLYLPSTGGGTGRNEIIATPCIVGNRMYLATGQDPEHGTGYADLWCVDITKQGDVSPELPADPAAAKPKAGEEELLADAANVPSRKGKPNPNSAVVWHFGPGQKGMKEAERMHRSISTVAVYNGLAFAGDFSGYLHCLDANTGKQLWAYDTEAEIWSSPMVIDGKVYIGNYDGDVLIFEAAPQMKQIAKHNMGVPVASTPVMANGTLYILGMQKLFAIQTGAAGAAGAANGANK